MSTETVEQFKWFIKERYAVHVKKERGDPKPWTTDPILQAYRFCNVHREDDTVTKWIAERWRNPNAAEPDLWFAMVVARLVNWPETLGALGYPKTFKPEHFVGVLARRAAVRPKVKVFSGAYIVSTNGHTEPKAWYLAHSVLAPLWAARAAVRPTKQDTLASFHERLWGFNGMGSFMAAQVVADVKYVEPLSKAADWWTWASSGPGSRRGLNRIRGVPPDTPWGREDRWKAGLDQLIELCDADLQAAGVPRLHAQNYQNCLCEVDKYLRTKLGQGRPRSKYPGAA